MRFSNWFSFLEEAEISFRVGKKPGHSDFDIEQNHLRINKVVAVVGANGSGKTQFIKPLAFISWFASQSFLDTDPSAPIPYSPHALGMNRDSNFEIGFIIHGSEYKYKLTLNSSRVVHESLYKKTSKLFSYIFVRDINYDQETFEVEYKQQNFGFPPTKAKEIRTNTSIISAAYNYDVSEAKPFTDYFRCFQHNISVHGRWLLNPQSVNASAQYFYEDKDVRDLMEELICEFDLGINGIKIQEIELKDRSPIEKNYLPSAIHIAGKKSFELPFYLESNGTQSAFVLLERILRALVYGGAAVIDEIDNDLHPHLLPQLIDLFKSKEINKNDSQLIFTCHTPEVLNLLKKHQVYLIEKVNQLSEAWRLDKVEGLRADDNLYSKYMAGTLGAVPNI